MPSSPGHSSLEAASSSRGRGMPVEFMEETVVDAEIHPDPPRPNLGVMLLSGTSALGVVTLLERGLGFLANLAVARVGGAQIFGAYSVAMTTATNVASYAGAGIGTTANRF